MKEENVVEIIHQVISRGYTSLITGKREGWWGRVKPGRGGTERRDKRTGGGKNWASHRQVNKKVRQIFTRGVCSTASGE